MAAELEQFLKDKLKDLPPDNPDRGYLERTLLETRLYLIGVKFPEEGLTEGLAQRVNSFASGIPDDARITDLILHPQDIVDHDLPPWQFEWKSFLKSLHGNEKKSISQILYPLLRGDIKTIGEFRTTPYEQLLRVRGIGERGAIFAKVAFLKREVTNTT